MISSLELRHIMENAFLPTKCVCTLNSIGRMTVTIGDENSPDIFTATGIDASRFSNPRAIAGLVAELKAEMKLTRVHGKYQSRG